MSTTDETWIIRSGKTRGQGWYFTGWSGTTHYPRWSPLQSRAARYSAVYVQLIGWNEATILRISRAVRLSPPRPACVRCNRRWIPKDGVDATVQPCDYCELFDANGRAF